jgi:small subunit ribosomal protein S8
MILCNSIHDMLIKIKNGQKSRKNYIYQYNSKLCLKILNIIYKEGYIKFYSIVNKKTIKIWLKYSNNLPVIKKFFFFPYLNNSFFLSLKMLWKIDLKIKLLILSTTKGFLSGKTSKKKGIGGKLICIIE